MQDDRVTFHSQFDHDDTQPLPKSLYPSDSYPPHSTSLIGENISTHWDGQGTSAISSPLSTGPCSFLLPRAVKDTPVTFPSQFDHDDTQPLWKSLYPSDSYPTHSTSLIDANISTHGSGQGTSATSLPLSTDFHSIPLSGNAQYESLSCFHPQSFPLHAGGNALTQEDDQRASTTSFSMSNNGRTIPCRWVAENGENCGQLITSVDCAAHLATAHGIKNLAPHLRIRCGWCYPPKQMKRASIVRHILGVHLRVKRKRAKEKM